MDMRRFREAIRNGCSPRRLHFACTLNDLGKGDEPAAPDYRPLAEASAESARIMGDLGKRQLDLSERQYEEAKPLVADVVKQQMQISSDTAAQGKDYYEYLKSRQRPVEDLLQQEAMRDTQSEQEAAAGRAMADVRQGTTQQQNQLIRQGIRYGWTPEQTSRLLADASTKTGLAIASAGNQAREREKALGYAKRLDVAGLYRGLPGASQGAYGVSLGAGSSAVANQAGPAQSYMQGLGMGAQTTGTGRSMLQQGLGTILNSQTALSSQPSDTMGGIGAMLGGGAQMWKAFKGY